MLKINLFFMDDARDHGANDHEIRPIESQWLPIDINLKKYDYSLKIFFYL